MNDELNKLIDNLIKQKGGSRKDYRLLLDKIAYHESKSDPTATQQEGGPGRGKYQFEVGDYKGANTAVNRTYVTLKKNNLKIPKWLEDIYPNKSTDASKLKGYQQDMLFLGNMMEHPKADFKKVMDGGQSVKDFWADHHWAGAKGDREIRMKAFDSSMESFNKKPIKQVEQPIQTPVNNTLMDYIAAKPIQEPQSKRQYNTNNEFKQGGLISNITSNGFNQFNTGGSHESSPLGGIPLGVGSNGKPNLVEENETSFDFEDGKYIFSDRITFGKK
jgi:hypothetical protein